MANIGILGFAHGHIFGFAGEWQKNPNLGVNVVCGWDVDDALRQKSCKGMNIDEAPDVDSLLAREDVDSVVICAQTAYHAQLVKSAAKAGKKIILYKPMALTLREADEIVEVIQQCGVPFTLAWQMRADPVNRKIRELILGGELGETYYFRRRHCLGVHNSPSFAATWHVDPALNRDIFADDCSHPADFLYSLFGLPETVMCEMSTMHSPLVKNDVGAAVFKYKNGLIAELMFSASCSAAEITTEVYLEKGAIAHYGGDGPSTRLEHEGQPALKWFREGDGNWTTSELSMPEGQWVRICALAEPLADFLNGGEPMCSAREARESLKMILACYLSNARGQRVQLDDEALYSV